MEDIKIEITLKESSEKDLKELMSRLQHTISQFNNDFSVGLKDIKGNHIEPLPFIGGHLNASEN